MIRYRRRNVIFVRKEMTSVREREWVNGVDFDYETKI